MKSGLEDRNNRPNRGELSEHPTVSMKSGLEDRNNQNVRFQHAPAVRRVSMKSGLEDRNNLTYTTKQFDKVFASQ